MLETVALPGEILKAVRDRYPALDAVRTGHELMRRQITIMVEDVIATTAGQACPAEAAKRRRCPQRRRDDGHLFA